MDRFEEKEMKKIRLIKNIWYAKFINYIPESITKIAGGFKDKIVSIFNNKHTLKNMYRIGKKLSKPKTQKQSEENKINSIRNCFISKTKEKEKKL